MKDGQSIETEQAPAPTDARATLLAELGDLTEDSLEVGSEPAASAEEGSPSEETAEAAEDDSPSSDTPEPDKGDPELERRLSEVQAAEKAGKEAVAREREALAKEKAAWEAERGKEQAYLDDLRARVKYDPVAVLTELGLTEDDFDPVARAVYASSTSAKADPKSKASSAHEMRLRKIEETARRAAEENKQLKQQIEEQRQRAEQEAAVNQYLDQVVKAPTDDTPIVSNLLKKSPEKARLALRRAAAELLNKHGEPADPLDVKLYLEQTERAELEARGVDVEALFLKTKAPDTTGEKLKRPETMEPTGNPTPPPSSDPVSREESIRKALDDWPT